MIKAAHSNSEDNLDDDEFDILAAESQEEGLASSDYLPARMINEFVYCPRLFYLMHVEGQFAPNADTTDGDSVHRRVDARVDPLPLGEAVEVDLPESTFEGNPRLAPSAQGEVVEARLTQSTLAFMDESSPTEPIQLGTAVTEPMALATGSPCSIPNTIHARSVTLASDELRVVAKLDLVEASGSKATPIDYKRGRPRIQSDGTLGAWLPEKVQLCLQAIVLRENGFQCDHGILYFNETRQRVPIAIDESLMERTRKAVHDARRLQEQSVAPHPLVESPKCPRCSLSPICLPDETNRCRSVEGKLDPTKVVRLPATPRDDLRPLYLNTQGLWVGKTAEVLQVKEQGKVVQEVRLREINQVNLFGNIQLSTQAMQTLLSLDIPVVMHSQHGYFQGMLQGTGLKNILVRREQFRMADDPERCLQIAKSLVCGKIMNQRVLLMRNHIAPPKEVLVELKRIVKRIDRVKKRESLLGVEGIAARLYFEQFLGMLKPGKEPIDPCNALATGPKYAFDFRGRNRRPPRDPVNAMLSLCYSLLAKDLTVIAAAVGLDPYLGFFHQVRPGRPALSLDLMEPFRALIADSVVITAVNNRMVYPEHFLAAGRGVTMSDPGRKAIFRAYEQRMDQLVTHPLFDYRVSYRRLLEIQTRLLARVITGELSEYPVFVTR